ncbi:MAG: YCF48-related protein [Bacteroidota bacterium]|nr:YCF48-related protein [Bacteroidota bacterium]
MKISHRIVLLCIFSVISTSYLLSNVRSDTTKYGSKLSVIKGRNFVINGYKSEQEPNNYRAVANPISYGDSVLASINPARDVDCYKFTASGGDTVEIIGLPRNNSSLIGDLFLMNGSSFVIAQSEYFTSNNSQRIIQAIPQTGDYYIRFSEINNSDSLHTSPGELSKDGPERSASVGDYMIKLSKFVRRAPIIGFFTNTFNKYNSATFFVLYYGNGCSSAAKIEYGTTTAYGSSKDLTSNPQGNYYEYNTTCTLDGLKPNTTYYVRVVMTNSMGVTKTQPMTIQTPSLPDGFTFINNPYITWDQYGVSLADSMNVYIASQHYVLNSTNGGNNWRYSESRNIDFHGIYYLNKDVSYAVGQTGTIAKTFNGGGYWSIFSTFPILEDLYSIYFTDINNGIAVGYNGTILRTTNAGLAWKSLSSPVKVTFYKITFTDSKNGYISGENGTILKTADGGLTWNQLNSGVTANLKGMSFADANNGYAVGGMGTILKTTDAGLTWKQQTSPVSNAILNSVFFTDANNGIAVGNSGVVLRTTNGGVNWLQKSSGTSADLNDAYAKDGTLLIVGSRGVTLHGYLQQPIKWQSALAIADKNNTTSKNIIFGQARSATDGIDAAIGEDALPPLPPTGIFDARFKLPSPSTESSIKDYRIDTLKSIDWKFQFQPGAGGYPMTFTWDPASLPEGTFYLKDLFGGIYVYINMKAQSSFTLTNAEMTSLKMEYKKYLTSGVNISSGWNLISVPVISNDMSTQSLFPGFSSSTYLFSNGYQPVTNLENGKGYWLRYGQTTNVPVTGSAVIPTTVPVSAGWNLIGVYERNIPVSTITTTPDNLLSSQFFGFSNGYFIPDTLRSGKGYWIRASQNGVLNIGLSSSSILAKQINIDDKWGRIIVEDNSGSRGVLYVSDKNEGLSTFDLPPMPPQGIFDLRYSTDRLVECGLSTIKISSANYPIKIKAEGMDIKVKDKVGGSIVNGTLKKGESLTIDNSSIQELQVESLSSKVPGSYELLQNYPNPFNPTTTIKYSLAKDSHVTLKIYNSLGEIVRELVNAQQSAGAAEAVFNADNLSSGIYFYEIEAKALDGSKVFRDVKKLTLIK